jgi:hypothetical protein
MAVRSRRCGAAHPGEPLPTSYRAPPSPSALGAALTVETEAAGSPSSC